MTYPIRDNHTRGHFKTPDPREIEFKDGSSIRDAITEAGKLDWLLLTVLILDLGLWVGLLAWWIWR